MSNGWVSRDNNYASGPLLLLSSREDSLPVIAVVAALVLLALFVAAFAVLGELRGAVSGLTG